jgi:hypothetical protein
MQKGQTRQEGSWGVNIGGGGGGPIYFRPLPVCDLEPFPEQ